MNSNGEHKLHNQNVKFPDKTFGVVEVKQNFTYHEKEHWKRVNLCDDVSRLPSQVVLVQL